MSKYAVYEIFGDSAPYNVEFCGHLAGALVGTSDKNPLSRQHDGVHEHVPHELAPIREKKQARLVKRGRDIITGASYEIWDVDDGRGIYVDYYKSVMDSKAFPVDMSHLMVDGEELRSWPYDATGGKAIRDLGYEPVED